jgi:hypothetical protein
MTKINKAIIKDFKKHPLELQKRTLEAFEYHFIKIKRELEELKQKKERLKEYEGTEKKIEKVKEDMECYVDALENRNILIKELKKIRS